MKDHQRNDGQQNLDDGVLVHDFNSFLFIIPDFSRIASLAQVSFGRADIFRLLYFIKSKVPSGNPAFWGFRYRFFPFSSELRFRFFRTLPALMPSLYFAKFAFSEMLSLAKILSRTPSPTAKSSICMIIHAYTDYQRFVI
uniref:hypothetical protein n=1 Tax=Gemmiger formicilis TaxID=745368 RepID=UPI004025109C